jgi:dipeptidase E
MKKILIASTSTIHGTDYLEYLLNVLEVHFKKADTVLFIPMPAQAEFLIRIIQKL